jgi:hypothetical protein
MGGDAVGGQGSVSRTTIAVSRAEGIERLRNGWVVVGLEDPHADPVHLVCVQKRPHRPDPGLRPLERRKAIEGAGAAWRRISHEHHLLERAGGRVTPRALLIDESGREPWENSIVMEYVHGTSAWVLVQQGLGPDPDDLVRFARGLFDALGGADGSRGLHGAQIAHRDLMADQVLIQWRRGRLDWAAPVIVDLGYGFHPEALFHDEEGNPVLSSQIGWKVGFEAPEQSLAYDRSIGGELVLPVPGAGPLAPTERRRLMHLHQASDLWAWAMTVGFVATGTNLIDPGDQRRAGTVVDEWSRLLRGEPARPAGLDAVPISLQAPLLLALHPVPGLRSRSAIDAALASAAMVDSSKHMAGRAARPRSAATSGWFEAETRLPSSSATETALGRWHYEIADRAAGGVPAVAKRRALDPQSRDRFATEIRALTTVRSALSTRRSTDPRVGAVPRVIEAWESSSSLDLVLSWLPGTTLAAMAASTTGGLAREGGTPHIDLTAAGSWLASLGLTIATALEAGWHHPLLTPDHLLVLDGDQVTAGVIGWGTATTQHSSSPGARSAVSQVAGTATWLLTGADASTDSPLAADLRPRLGRVVSQVLRHGYAQQIPGDDERAQLEVLSELLESGLRFRAGTGDIGRLATAVLAVNASSPFGSSLLPALAHDLREAPEEAIDAKAWFSIAERLTQAGVDEADTRSRRGWAAALFVDVATREWRRSPQAATSKQIQRAIATAWPQIEAEIADRPKSERNPSRRWLETLSKRPEAKGGAAFTVLTTKGAQADKERFGPQPILSDTQTATAAAITAGGVIIVGSSTITTVAGDPVARVVLSVLAVIAATTTIAAAIWALSTRSWRDRRRGTVLALGAAATAVVCTAVAVVLA